MSEPATVVELHRGSVSTPSVTSQSGPHVVVTDAGSLPLGTWLAMGAHVGVVKRHQGTKALVDLLLERSGRSWGAPRRAVPLGVAARPVDEPTWTAIQASLYEDPVPVGTIRQDELSCTASLPALTDVRAICAGKSRSGKSTGQKAWVVAWRRSVRHLGPGERPGCVVIDPHGDYCGKARHKGIRKPGLPELLTEPVRVFGTSSLTCLGSDLPAPLLLGSIKNLSSAQRRWVETYVIADDDHAPIETLLRKPEAEWSGAFPEFCQDGELSRSTLQTLTTLRAKLTAFFAPPLFRRGGESTWRQLLTHARNGGVAVVDVSEFPPVQKTLLTVLLLRHVMAERFAAQRRDEALPGLVIVGDEMHLMTGAADTIESAFRESAKLGVGLLLGSQSVVDLPEIAVTNSNYALLFRLDGVDARRAIARWPELRANAAELMSQAPGDAFLVGANVAVPIRVAEPQPRRAT